MDERDTFCNSCEIRDRENECHVQCHPHRMPSLPPSSTPSLNLTNVNILSPDSGNMNNYELRASPDHRNQSAFHVMTQHNNSNHPTTNHEIGAPRTSNFFNVQWNPTSGVRVFPTPYNHDFANLSPSSSNYSYNDVVPFGEHIRNNLSANGVRGICKRQNVNGIPENDQQLYSSPTLCNFSTIPRMSSCHFDSRIEGIDVPLALPEFEAHENSLSMDVPRSGVYARHRPNVVRVSTDTTMVHSSNHLPHGSHGCQPFQPSNCTWLEQQTNNNNNAFPWSRPSIFPYYRGNNIHGGSIETVDSGMHGYSDVTSNRVPTSFLNSPPILRHHQNFRLPQNIPRVRGYGTGCFSPFVPTSNTVLTNDRAQHDVNHISQDIAQPSARPTENRICHSNRRSLLPDTTSRQRDLSCLRSIPPNRIALLEISNFYEADREVDNFIDHHRDMRLDIDDMSYEELLALSEQIGTVSTGLSERDITHNLKTRFYSSSTINQEELQSLNHKDSFCIICQDEYENNDKLGTLECGHEYHVNCLEKWLPLKNVCPICKSSALTTQGKDQ